MRVSLGGNITVIAQDQWYAQIRASRAFVLGGAQASVGGQYGHVQILNPAATGVNVIVYSILAGKTTAGAILVHRYDTALATLIGQGVNLLAGGAAGLAAVRSGSNAAQLGTQMVEATSAAMAFVPIMPGWSVQLGPTQGIVVLTDIVNERVTATFEWIELPV